MDRGKETPGGILDLISRIRETSSEILRREMEKNNVEGIVPAHGKILFYLFHEEKPVPLADVIKASGRVKSTITGMVTTLEKNGYLMRQDSREDRRSVLVELTPKGRALHELFDRISEEIIRSIYMGIPESEQAAVTETLSRINSNLINTLGTYQSKEKIQ